MDQYMRVNSLVERRSKGKLFIAYNLLDKNTKVVQRIIDVV